LVFLINYSFVIPAFNEGCSLQEAVDNFVAVATELEGSFEIIIVDDGSTDNTAKIIKDLQQQYAFISAINLVENQGKGYAVRTGLINCNSRSNVYGFIDGDLDIDPTFAKQMIDSISTKASDVAIASKLHALSHVDYPISRKLLSRSFRLLTLLFLNVKVTDTQTGMKFFSQDVYKDVIPMMASNSYSFDLEFLSFVAYYDYKISEHPVIIRHGFSSSVGLKNSLLSIFDVYLIWKRLKKFKSDK
jgi:dolichyl-phosphate beta-glucosyltransferase